MLGIVNYSDSESEDDIKTEDENATGTEEKTAENGAAIVTGVVKQNTDVSLKRRAEGNDDDSESDEDEETSCKERKLPLPSLFRRTRTIKDEKHKHEGRKRTFDHFEGNWATYVYIPVNESPNFVTIYDRITNNLRRQYGNVIHYFPVNSCHVSISRTVPIRHYWMTPLFEKLKELFACKKKFFYSLASIKVYTNDEKTRTFVGLDVSTGHETYLNFIKNVDGIFKEFNLEKYYECPSFHASIAWCLGNKKEKLEKFFEEHSPVIMAGFPGGIVHQLADKVCMKSGNKLFQIALE